MKYEFDANQFNRTRALIGDAALEKLAGSAVLVFGVGGVGGFVVEALVRSGVGKIDIVDFDTVDITNINRQIIATYDTVGKPKVDVMKQRMLSINPSVSCEAMNLLYKPGDASIDFSKYDYVVDCIDDVPSKIEIISKAKEAGKCVISSMGTGNKLDPTKFTIADIEKTSVCPLARAVRKELRKRDIKHVKVLFSTEEPRKSEIKAPTSIAFVPSVAGLVIAGEVVRDLIKEE